MNTLNIPVKLIASSKERTQIHTKEPLLLSYRIHMSELTNSTTPLSLG